MASAAAYPRGVSGRGAVSAVRLDGSFSLDGRRKLSGTSLVPARGSVGRAVVGISAVSRIGSETLRATALVRPASVSASSAVGRVEGRGNITALPSGVAGVALIRSAVARGASLAPSGGAGVASALGSVSARGGAARAASGVCAAASVRSAPASGSARPSVVGLSAVAGVGPASCAVGALVACSGLSAACAVSAVSASGRASVAAAPVGADAAVGAVSAVGSARSVVNGFAASAAVVSASCAADASVACFGLRAAVAVGAAATSVSLRVHTGSLSSRSLVCALRLDGSFVLDGRWRLSGFSLASASGGAVSPVSGAGAASRLGSVTPVAAARIPVVGLPALSSVGDADATSLVAAFPAGVASAAAARPAVARGTALVESDGINVATSLSSGSAGAGATAAASGIATAASSGAVSAAGYAGPDVSGLLAVSGVGAVSFSFVLPLPRGCSALGATGWPSAGGGAHAPASGVAALSGVGMPVFGVDGWAPVSGIQALSRVGVVLAAEVDPIVWSHGSDLGRYVRGDPVSLRISASFSGLPAEAYAVERDGLAHSIIVTVENDCVSLGGSTLGFLRPLSIGYVLGGKYFTTDDVLNVPLGANAVDYRPDRSNSAIGRFTVFASRGGVFSRREFFITVANNFDIGVAEVAYLVGRERASSDAQRG